MTPWNFSGCGKDMEGRGDAYIRTSQGWEGGEPCGWGEKGRAREEDRHVPIILVILT